MPIQIKRIYEAPDSLDGKRIVVDRLWPRGVAKEQAHVDVWMREIAPSPQLRKWFAHRPELFEEFKHLYRCELIQDPIRINKMNELIGWAAEGPVTLLYAAKNPVHNHATVLLKMLHDTIRNRTED